jgi:hypothetical protein
MLKPALLALVVALLPGAPESLTLSVDRGAVTYGDPVRLSGVVEPAAERVFVVGRPYDGGSYSSRRFQTKHQPRCGDSALIRHTFLRLSARRADIHECMKDAFQGFTAVWRGPDGKWPVWIAARSQADASVCAMITFAVLESQAERPRASG